MDSPAASFQYADKYSFYAEWYNEVADVIKPFILSFYPMDGTLELFDLKCCRMFLRRTKIDGITLKSLYNGSNINIFCRQITVVGYANTLTRRVFEEVLQSIFFLIKPSAINMAGKILHLLEENDFKISKLKMGRLTQDGAEKFHEAKIDSPLRERENIEELSNAACIAVEVVGENGLARWMDALAVSENGEHPPCLGHGDAPPLETNFLPHSVHYSFCASRRDQESNIWFPPEGKNIWVKRTCKLNDSTCCVIKPHAVEEALVGRIIDCIYGSGFSIEAMKLMHLDRAGAEKFYEVYKGIVPEYSSMVSQLASGAFIALEVRHIAEPSSSTQIFRQLVGTNDPNVAKQLQPNSIRAKFGKTTVMNAVHCTDLPEDANFKKRIFTSSPLCAGKVSHRSAALGWDVRKDFFLDGNQSFPAELPSRRKGKMDWMKSFGDDGLKSARKWAYNQSPLHASTSRDETWMLNESNVNSSTHPSNTLFETSGLLASSSKAAFTLSLPSTQILIVNAVACKLLGFTADELCAMTLNDLIPDPHQLSGLLTESSGAIQLTPHAYNTGAVVELCTHEGLRLPVFLFFKEIDAPERCVAVAELVDRRTASLTIGNDGNILIFDDEAVTLFQYDAAELTKTNIKTLIPGVELVSSDKMEGSKQRVTGRTKGGVSFPLCVMARPTASADGWHVVILVYSSLSGVVFIHNDLTIVNCNHLFATLLFGYSKEQLLKESILKILPGFCNDSEYGRERTMTGDRSNDSCSESPPERLVHTLPEDSISAQEYADFPSPPPLEDQPIVLVSNDVQDCEKLMDELLIDSGAEDDSSIAIIKESDLDLQNEMTEKLSCLNMNGLGKNKCSGRMRSSRSDDVLAKAKHGMRASCSGALVAAAVSSQNLKETSLQEFPMNRTLNVTNLSDVDNDEVSKKIVEGTFAGWGRHRDGAEMDVIYKVRAARGHNGFLVCIARDPWEPAEGGRRPPPNLTVTCSFNSTSFDNSLPRDDSRPNSASIISQCDDVLTSGDYSAYYTNLQQIGKGAFGYVKMAYRNHDGLLVITKFIKKNKIHVRSWVVDPTLQMKVPLEMSLLTTLDHPHIVRVMDVFHNDGFFQLVMEKHGSGMDLFEFIDRKPKMDEKLASFIFRQMVSAVHYLHSLGILHRDIKDENVIINETFHVKLIDFGSAAFMSPGRVFSTFYGTVEYCSPEVLQGNSYKGPELEIWALGVTLFVLMFGENPFYDVEETIKGEFVIPKPVSSQLFSLIQGMLEKDVNLRWDISRVFADPWVNVPVDAANYSFQKVVRCDIGEIYPAKYLSEYVKEEMGRDDDDEDRTVASSNSFCSLHTIENLDDSALPVEDKACEDTGGYLLQPRTYMLSSTPRRASATKVAVSTNTTGDSDLDARKRYSLDLVTLKKLCESDQQSRSKVSLPNLKNLETDAISTKPSLDDIENYWDAEDEQYDEDSY